MLTCLWFVNEMSYQFCLIKNFFILLLLQKQKMKTKKQNNSWNYKMNHFFNLPFIFMFK